MSGFLATCLIPLTFWHFLLLIFCLGAKSKKLFPDESDRKMLSEVLCLKDTNKLLPRTLLCAILFVCSLTGAIWGLCNQELGDELVGVLLIAFWVIMLLIVAFYLFLRFFKNLKNATLKQKIAKVVGGLFCICLAITLSILIIINPGCHSSNKNNNNDKGWDDLTEEEKDWYRDNYGNGQYDKYQDAIDKYKNSK